MRLLCSLLFCASAFAGEWRSAGPYGGSATAIAIDPQTSRRLLAGTHSSLVFLSENAGEWWKPLPFPRHFFGDLRVVQFDPADSHRLFVGVQLSNSAEAGLYESRDDGQHWRAIAALRGLSVEALTFWAADPRRMIAGTRDGAYLSIDGGTNWSRLTPKDNDELRTITAAAIDPTDAHTMYAGTPHLPWRTIDGGATWQSMRAGMVDDSDVMSIEIDWRSPRKLYASACSGIYHSETQGSRWAKYGGQTEAQRRTHVIRQDPVDPLILYAGTTAGLLKSGNGGASWAQVNRYEINGIAIDSQHPNVVYLATERSGVVKSVDHGGTFREANAGFANRVLRGIADSPQGVYALSRGELFLAGDGHTWRETGKAPAGHPANGSPLAALGSALLYAHEAGVLRSTDSGATWHAVLPSESDVGSFVVNAIQIVRGGVIFSTATTIRRSADGAAWTAVQTVQPASAPRAFAVSPDGVRVTALTGGQSAMLSPDAGLHWRNILLPPEARSVNALAWGDDHSALLLAASAGLFRSMDEGATWTRITGGLPGGSISHVLFLPGTSGAVALSFGALYRSRDGGLHWKLEAATPTPAPRVQTLMLVQTPSVRVLCETVDMGLLFLEPEP